MSFILNGFKSDVVALKDVRNSILLGFGLFLFTLPFMRSSKSFFDARAARKILLLLRGASLLALLLIIPLFYCVINLGSPITTNSYTVYGDGNTWIYGYGRPSAGFALITFGIVAGMHPIPRIFCIIGATSAIIFDSLSAFQVMDYYSQMNNNLAPNPAKYTQTTLLYYYYRDLSSITTCTYLLMMTLLASIVMGCKNPQLISYHFIDNEHFNRSRIMNEQSKNRRYIDELDHGDDQSIVDKATRKRQRKELRRVQRIEEKEYLLSINANDLAEMQRAAGNKSETLDH